MGTGSLDRSLLDEIVGRIVRTASPARIILFGSHATGTAGPASDVDMLVVEDSPPDVRAEATRIRRALSGLGIAFDVIVMSTQRFEETKSVVGGIAHPAHKYGRTVYEAA
jgi:predicted nucleotidyltransferase